MVMVKVKGIPAGEPILDEAAVWTPPHVGPSDAAHIYLSHALRGRENPVRSWPDMASGADLRSNNGSASFADSATSPLVTVSQGLDALAATGALAAEQAVLLVAQIVANKTAQVSVPGWVIGGGGTGRLGIGGASAGTFSASIPAGLAVYVLTLKAGAVEGYINGASVGTLTLNPGTGTNIKIGTNVYSSQVAEQYGLLKIWKRILTPDEIAEATADARALFSI